MHRAFFGSIRGPLTQCVHTRSAWFTHVYRIEMCSDRTVSYDQREHLNINAEGGHPTNVDTQLAFNGTGEESKTHQDKNKEDIENYRKGE